MSIILLNTDIYVLMEKHNVGVLSLVAMARHRTVVKTRTLFNVECGCEPPHGRQRGPSLTSTCRLYVDVILVRNQSKKLYSACCAGIVFGRAIGATQDELSVTNA